MSSHGQTNRSLNIVFVGLSLSSSWGNGHATTYRSLLRGLHELGHRVMFLERDVDWYAANRDMDCPHFAELRYYHSAAELASHHAKAFRAADVVVVGSYVFDGVSVIDVVSTLCTGQLCFYDIDTPVTLSKLMSDDREYLAARQVSWFDIYFSFAGGPILQQLRTDFGARRTVPLYCSVDLEGYAPTGEAPLWDLGYLGTYSADRQAGLDRLLVDVARRLPKLRFVVAGPQYPPDLGWPDNVDRIAHLPPSEHASFYSRQRYALNVTRRDMVAAGWSPSVRLFEAAACATPVISDRWSGLDDVFPIGDAIHVADSTEEVCNILSTSTEADRNLIAARAREIVSLLH